MFEKENIYLDLEVKNKDELFTLMSKIFYEKGYIKEGYLESLKEREEKYPTGLCFLDYNIAIPHTYYEFVKKEKIIFIRLKNSIKFIEMGTNDENLNVSIILMLLVNKGERQAELLQYIINKMSNKETYMNLKNSNNKEEIFNILKNN